MKDRLRLAWEQMEKSNVRWLYVMLCALTVVAGANENGRAFLPLLAFVHFYVWLGFYYKAVGK